MKGDRYFGNCAYKLTSVLDVKNVYSPYMYEYIVHNCNNIQMSTCIYRLYSHITDLVYNTLRPGGTLIFTVFTR